MSPSKPNSYTSTSNCNGETVGHQTSILASAYCVDTSARLSGFQNNANIHPQITLLPAPAGPSGIPEVLGIQGIPAPPSSPPLAALTSANELALMSKSRGNDHTTGARRNGGRKEGAAYYIRGECERLFCETMKDVFLGEEGTSSSNGSFVMGADLHNAYPSPPNERRGAYDQSDYYGKTDVQDVDAWIEVWDYVGGASFRGFVGGNGENKSLFAFFDSAVIGRDLKQGLMALIELAETVFDVSQVVVCVDRSVPDVDRKAFLKSLRWVGFELVSLDLWGGGLDMTSDKWLFLGMEI
ncbi:Uncharacterized protein BP5553_05044 [Venustampulla echinocandica]|uniref:Ornithine decarboxylase antizyme n=1 Tax=Venustampulla echinocandica TaxID=2656787 RepID=A0A370TQ07_9HELO|nr:Uncharacterized protein BP5553_05044 [Venustampulla echinocandica]RDL37611.1 Uncharacterized protein BP5553_05044 [Venustampulla echinocandica]